MQKRSPALRRSRHCRRVIHPLVSCLTLTLGLALLWRQGVAAAQGDTVYYVPDAQSPERIVGQVAGGVLANRAAPDGMEGWGRSTIDIQNGSDRPLTYRYVLHPVDGTALEGSESLAPRAQARLDLGVFTGAIPSFYHGTLVTSQPAGVIVRTHWAAGGATAYEAPEASKDLVIPMLLHGISTLTTMFYIQNSILEGGSPDANRLEYSFPSNATGGEILEIFQDLRPGESGYEDTSFSPMFNRLPPREGGGYIGALWLHAEEPIATLQYFEDAVGTASAALRAVPVSKAANRQLLPWARAGDHDGSLLGIASVSELPAAMTIRYLAASTGAEVARQTVALAAHGAAYIDLGKRGLGTVPRATGLRDDFDGSILFESDTAILVSIFDEDGLDSASNGSAYNAFGPGELSASVAVPSLAVTGKQSELLIQNGEASNVTAEVTFLDAGGDVVGSAERLVTPGARWTLLPSAAGVPGNLDVVSAIVEASGGIAVMVREWDLGDGLDVAISAGVPLRALGAPTTPSTPRTPTPTPSTPTAGTVTPVTSTPTGGTPTGGTPTGTASPTPTGSDVIPFRLFLPRAYARNPTFLLHCC